MQGLTLKNLILGFIAGAIATLTIHEIIKYFFFDAGVIPLQPWDMTPIAGGPFPGVIPKIVNDAFWGGLWGAVFALILGNVPKGSMTLRGILLGIVGPAVLGVFVLVPLLKGAPLFFGGNIPVIVAVLSILAGFGAVTAWLYGFLASGCRLP